MQTTVIEGMQTWPPHAHTARKMKRSLQLILESEAIGFCKRGSINKAQKCIQRYSLMSGLISNKLNNSRAKTHESSHLAAKS